jgi:adenylate kinase family enzyme
MRLLIMGNSGSGKSYRARALAAQHGLVHLDLDTIVWEPGKIAATWWKRRCRIVRNWYS